MLHAALNGARDHPATPRTSDEIAAEARAAVAAGAIALHFHPYDADGRETLEAERCAEAVRAVRAACPGVPVSLSTSAAIEPDPERRHALVGAWTELPDLVTANQGEDGIVALCEMLFERGVGVEAGILELAAAMESVVAEAGIGLDQVHHGDGIASWAVNRRAVERGHGIRTGLEDTPVLADGRLASGNGELVAAAAAILGEKWAV